MPDNLPPLVVTATATAFSLPITARKCVVRGGDLNPGPVLLEFGPSAGDVADEAFPLFPGISYTVHLPDFIMFLNLRSGVGDGVVMVAEV